MKLTVFLDVLNVFLDVLNIFWDVHYSGMY